MAGVKKGERIGDEIKKKCVEMYADGKSLLHISREIGLSYSTVQRTVLASGIMRKKMDARRAVGWDCSRALRGIKRQPYSAEVRQKMSESAIKRWDKTSPGLRITSQGYVAYTRAPMCEKLYHRVFVESFIGRKLKKDEVIHHKDGNKQNNEISNLVIMTSSEHMSCHRKRSSK